MTYGLPQGCPRQAALSSICHPQQVDSPLAHELGDLPAEHVVHDAGALLKVVEAGHQGADGCLRVPGVQPGNLLVWLIGQGAKELSQVAAHVGVWTVPDRQVGHLSKGLQEMAPVK